eukprot:1134426-Pelagomonas_calceolata.AAC.6
MPNSARENEEINEKIRREQAEGGLDCCSKFAFCTAVSHNGSLSAYCTFLGSTHSSASDVVSYAHRTHTHTHTHTHTRMHMPMRGPPRACLSKCICVCMPPAGDLCPRTIFLGINNTIKEENDSICQVAIFSPLWVDNRTGFDLIFRDLDVPSAFNDLPFLSEFPLSFVLCVFLSSTVTSPAHVLTLTTLP